ncbi:MAG TPA: hypothetical protein VGN16_25295 [Acidobacteriaceae bacterium]
MKTDETELREGHTRYRQIAVALILPALLVTGIHEGRHWTAALLWCAALLMVGAFLGMFFAVPRFRVPPPRSNSEPGTQLSSADPSAVNTNLESIADWMTKILIGVALVDIRQAPQQIRQLTLYVESNLNGKGDEPFVTATLLFFSLSGFMFSYIESRLYFRTLASAEGARTIGSLSKALEAALSAPAMVNYQGVLCLGIRQDGERLDLSHSPVSLRQPSGRLELEVWLQRHNPDQSNISCVPVSITGGKNASKAEFEIRFDSDSFQSDKASQTVVAPIEGVTRRVLFRAEFNELSRMPEQPFVQESDTSAPQNPVWVMLFQNNRLVQTMALDFTLR